MTLCSALKTTRDLPFQAAMQTTEKIFVALAAARRDGDRPVLAVASVHDPR
jgi:hypothetical protein